MDRNRPGKLRFAGAFALVCVAAFSNTAFADTAKPAVLAATCANCHGAGGVSPSSMPSIDKLDAGALSSKLKGFRAGELEATVMTRIAKGYTDAEIDALGQYFSSLSR